MEPLMSSRYHLAVAGNHEMTQILGGVGSHKTIVAMMYVPNYIYICDGLRKSFDVTHLCCLAAGIAPKKFLADF